MSDTPESTTTSTAPDATGPTDANPSTTADAQVAPEEAPAEQVVVDLVEPAASGATAETAGTPSAADLDRVAEEHAVATATAGTPCALCDEDNATLLDAALFQLHELTVRVDRLEARISTFNEGAPHKI